MVCNGISPNGCECAAVPCMLSRPGVLEVVTQLLVWDTGFPPDKHHMIHWLSESKRSSKGSARKGGMRHAIDMVQ